MKKMKVFALTMIFVLVMITGCGGSAADTVSSDAENTDTTAADTEGAADTSVPSGTADDDVIRIGFAVKALDNPFYVKISETIKEYAQELGWECTVLSGDNNIEKEAANMESLIVQNMDLIFMLPLDPETCIPSINNAVASGIPVICLDDAPGEGANNITTVWSDNLQNGRLVGLDYVASIGDEPINAILISGSKGNISGEERRTGMFCGILEGRLGISEEEAMEMAEAFNETLISAGRAECEEADFTVAGIGWGNWNEEGGLIASEDLITANSNLTLIMGENDQMLFGAITALKNAGLEDVDIIAASDGAQRGYDYIKEGVIFAIGENSPIMVARKGMDVAKEILIDGVDPDTYDKITVTQAISVTIDNVDERYEYGT